MLSERPSSASQTLKLITPRKLNYDDMTEEQLRTTLGEVMHKNRTLTLENEVFERYLRRKDPECLHHMPVILESHLKLQQLQQVQQVQPAQHATARVDSASMSVDKTSSTPSIVRTSSSVVASMPKHNTKGVKIAVAHRAELTEKEIEEIKRQHDSFEKTINKKIENLRALLQEMHNRIADCEEVTELFKENVIHRVDPITKQITKSTFIKFMEDQFKIAGTTTDKLNLKIVTTKRLITQSKAQLLKIEKIGKYLRHVDFHKIRIEIDYLIYESEKNNLIVNDLKRFGAHYNMMLKDNNSNLIEKKAILKSLENDLAASRRINDDLNRRQVVAKCEIRKELGQLNDIRDLRAKYQAPEILDFLNVQRQLQEARQRYRRLNMQRKLNMFTIK